MAHRAESDSPVWLYLTVDSSYRQQSRMLEQAVREIIRELAGMDAGRPGVFCYLVQAGGGRPIAFASCL